MGVLGANTTRARVRRMFEAAIRQVPGCRRSEDPMTLENLPEAIRDRAWDVQISGIGARERSYADTTEVSLTCVVTYAKLVGSVGDSQRKAIATLEEDTEAIYQAIMSDGNLKTAEVAFESEAGPEYITAADSTAMVLTQTFSVYTRRDHAY